MSFGNLTMGSYFYPIEQNYSAEPIGYRIVWGCGCETYVPAGCFWEKASHKAAVTSRCPGHDTRTSVVSVVFPAKEDQ